MARGLLERLMSLVRRSAGPSTRLLELARSGSVKAQSALGDYFFRQDKPLFHGLSHHWNQAAAMQGDAGAQARLATIYHEGIGIERNKERAFRFALLAAMQGHPGAQFLVGGLYEMGQGTPSNRVAALFWLYQCKNEDPDDFATILFDDTLARASEEEKRSLIERLKSN